LRNSNTSSDVKEINKKNKQEMDNDPFYQGVPSLVNAYSITKLYGSNGGQYLLDRKDTRK
jgi:maltose-binding protein MalE